MCITITTQSTTEWVAQQSNRVEPVEHNEMQYTTNLLYMYSTTVQHGVAEYTVPSLVLKIEYDTVELDIWCEWPS